MGQRWGGVLGEGFAEGCGSMIHGSLRKEHSRQRDWSGQKPEAGACLGPSGRSA